MNLRKCKIKDLGYIYTGNTPPTSERKYYGDKYPLIKPTDMKVDGRYIGKTEESLSEEGYNLFKGKLVPENTPCVVTIGTIGKLCLTKEPSFCNQAVNSIVVNRELYDPLYVFYLMKISNPKVKFLSSGTASGRENVSKTAFENIEVEVFPLPTQRKIAAILSAYDDLIENNTRRIKLLEEMAQTLYREWFVKFRFPGHEKVKMVESELGMVPEGWKVKEMREVADVIDCLHSKKPIEFKGGTRTLLQLFNIADCGKLDLSNRFFISDDDYLLWTSRIEASCGDCVVTNVGRIAAVAQIPEGEKVALGRNMTAIRAKTGIITSTYLIEYLLSSHMDNEVEKKKDTGTIMDSLNVKGIVKLSVPIPPVDLMDTFERIARPLRRRIELLMNQNANLRRTRDMLLPKLISGEVDVSNFDIKTDV